MYRPIVPDSYWEDYPACLIDGCDDLGEIEGLCHYHWTMYYDFMMHDLSV